MIHLLEAKVSFKRKGKEGLEGARATGEDGNFQALLEIAASMEVRKTVPRLAMGCRYMRTSMTDPSVRIAETQGILV